jgi:hypothetical protein
LPAGLIHEHFCGAGKKTKNSKYLKKNTSLVLPLSSSTLSFFAHISFSKVTQQFVRRLGEEGRRRKRRRRRNALCQTAMMTKDESDPCFVAKTLEGHAFLSLILRFRYSNSHFGLYSLFVF